MFHWYKVLHDWRFRKWNSWSIIVKRYTSVNFFRIFRAKLRFLTWKTFLSLLFFPIAHQLQKFWKNSQKGIFSLWMTMNFFLILLSNRGFCRKISQLLNFPYVIWIRKERCRVQWEKIFFRGSPEYFLYMNVPENPYLSVNVKKKILGKKGLYLYNGYIKLNLATCILKFMSKH